jgi:hypothetical protein
MDNLNKGNGEYFGPDDELSNEVKSECIDRARKNLTENKGFDLELNLEKDDTDFREPGQEIACVSFVGPYDSLKAKHDTLQFNLRGSCDTIDETRQRLTDIQKKTKKYDIYTLEMYTWIAVPPNPKFMEDNDAHEVYLNKLISSHRFKMEINKEMFEARKGLMTENDDTNVEVDKLLEDVSKESVAEATESEATEVTESEVETVPKLDVKEFVKTNNTAEERFKPKEKLNECADDDQNYAVVSIVGNDKMGRALKIKGFYETEAEARTKADLLSEIDDTFENYVVESYRWLPVNIEPDQIEDQVYRDESLNEMHSKYKTEQKKANIQLKKQPPGTQAPPKMEIENITDSETGAPSAPSAILKDLETDVEKIKM